jgi:uncharacterized membrane protein YfcA
MNTENKNHGFLKDSKGQKSSVRAGMFIAVVSACGLAFYGLYKEVELLGLTTLCGAFLGAGFGAKVWQKGRAND